ncbi:MAG: hypothetical protein ACOYMN_02610 [Roseimicrobium sp.]
MIYKDLSSFVTVVAMATTLTSCGMFGSSSRTASSATAAQEFDPFTHTWKPSSRVVVPPASQPNVEYAERKAAEEKENNTLSQVGRAVGNTASAAGRAVKKPLEWFAPSKKEEPDQPSEAEMREALPALPAKAQ